MTDPVPYLGISIRRRDKAGNIHWEQRSLLLTSKEDAQRVQDYRSDDFKIVETGLMEQVTADQALSMIHLLAKRPTTE